MRGSRGDRRAAQHASPPEIGLQIQQVEPRLVLADAALEDAAAAAAAPGTRAPGMGGASVAAAPGTRAPGIERPWRPGRARRARRAHAGARRPALDLARARPRRRARPAAARRARADRVHVRQHRAAQGRRHQPRRTRARGARVRRGARHPRGRPHARHGAAVPNTGYADQLATVLMAGGAVDLVPAFSRAAVREALIRRPATYLIAVPGVLRCSPRARTPTACSPPAGSPHTAARRCRRHGSPSSPPAGRTCGSPRLPAHRVHVAQPRHGARRRPDSLGRPVLGAEQLIVGDDGAPVATGATGHILLAGPSRMTAYWRAPERTREALRGRWLVTGDVGSVARDGLLRLVGRASEVINRGGEKVSPAQVEAAMSAEPAVAEAGVVGAPDPVLGERVVAFVTLRRAASLDPATTRRRLRRTLADYAVPERFVVVDDLPYGRRQARPPRAPARGGPHRHREPAWRCTHLSSSRSASRRRPNIRSRGAAVEQRTEHAPFSPTLLSWGHWLYQAAFDPETASTMVAARTLNGENSHVFWHMATSAEDLAP